MSNPKISIIIPVYNSEKYLSECLDSIVNQTLKEIEIICVNDGSTDNSLSILKEYTSKDKRIKIIDKENEGQGYARKCGLDIANGKYILFCDSDDYYAELTAFEELYNYIENVKSDVVLFDFIQKNVIDKSIDYKTNYKYPKDVLLKKRWSNREIFSYLDIDNLFIFYVTFWCKLYSKKFLDSYDDWYFPKKILYEDNPFHFQILLRANISYLHEYLLTHIIRVNSIMTLPIKDKNLFDFFIIHDEIYAITKNKCRKFEFLSNFFYSFVHKFSNYQINNIEIINILINFIRQFSISDLFELKNKQEFFFFRSALRMTPENYMEYLNKKNLKTKNKEIAKLKEYKKKCDTRISKLNEQIKNKNEQLQQKNEAIAKRDNWIKDKNEQIKNKNEQLQQKNEQLQQKNEQIKNRDSVINQKNSEIQNLHTQNNIQEQQIKRLQNSWSYRIGRLFTYPLSIPLDFYKYIRDYNLLKKSDLFDSEYYLANNEDVKKAKMNPIKHYLKFGWKEGRNPSADFNGNEYLNKRPDVRVSGICPLVHYLKFGKEK